MRWISPTRTVGAATPKVAAAVAAGRASIDDGDDASDAWAAASWARTAVGIKRAGDVAVRR